MDSTDSSTPAPQPVAGRRHLPKRCFGSGCARPVATLKGAGTPAPHTHSHPGIQCSLRVNGTPPSTALILSDLGANVQYWYSFGRHLDRWNRSAHSSRKAIYGHPLRTALGRFREHAGNATAVTESTRCAGPPLALRPKGGHGAVGVEEVDHGRNRGSAMNDPAGQESGQEAAGGAVDAVEVQCLAAGDGLPGGDLVALEGDPGELACLTRHAGGSARAPLSAGAWCCDPGWARVLLEYCLSGVQFRNRGISGVVSPNVAGRLAPGRAGWCSSSNVALNMSFVDLERCHARHSGLVRYVGRILGNQGTVGRDTEAIRPGSGVERRFSCKGRSGRGGSPGADRATVGQDLGTARRPWRVGTSDGDFVRNLLASDRGLSSGRR